MPMEGGAGANASTSLTQTFGTSISVSESTTESETYSITVSGNTTAVFEVWNLVEQYTFSNADGTPYEDPNYRFSLPSLTSRATIATAFVATPFPN